MRTVAPCQTQTDDQESRRLRVIHSLAQMGNISSRHGLRNYNVSDANQQMTAAGIQDPINTQHTNNNNSGQHASLIGPSPTPPGNLFPHMPRNIIRANNPNQSRRRNQAFANEDFPERVRPEPTEV